MDSATSVYITRWFGCSLMSTIDITVSVVPPTVPVLLTIHNPQQLVANNYLSSCHIPSVYVSLNMCRHEGIYYIPIVLLYIII